MKFVDFGQVRLHLIFICGQYILHRLSTPKVSLKCWTWTKGSIFVEKNYMIHLHILRKLALKLFCTVHQALCIPLTSGQPSWALWEGSSGSFLKLRPSMVSSILAARVRSWVSWSGWSSLFADSRSRLFWSGTVSRVGRSPLCPPRWRPFQYQRWRLVFLRKEKLYKHDEGGLSGSHHLSTRGF